MGLGVAVLSALGQCVHCHATSNNLTIDLIALFWRNSNWQEPRIKAPYQQMLYLTLPGLTCKMDTL